MSAAFSKRFFLCATRSGSMFEGPRQPFSEIFIAYQSSVAVPRFYTFLFGAFLLS